VPEGDDGTKVVKLSSEKRTAPVLTDAEVARLATLGKIVGGSLRYPQDVEWAIVGDEIFILQSRPITTIRRPEIPRPGAEPAPEAESALGVVLLEGQGASPGDSERQRCDRAGCQRHEHDQGRRYPGHQDDNPDMVPAMRRVRAIRPLTRAV